MTYLVITILFIAYWIQIAWFKIEKDITLIKNDRFHVGLIWAWFDVWIGIYITRGGRRVFIMLPTIGITFTLYRRLNKNNTNPLPKKKPIRRPKGHTDEEPSYFGHFSDGGDFYEN